MKIFLPKISTLFGKTKIDMFASRVNTLLERLVQIVRQDKAEVLLIAPLWVTQNWSTTILEMKIDTPLIFKVQKNVLTIPPSLRINPLVDKLHLMVCRISGIPLKAENFRNNLQISSWHQ
jgi:hypothetical protein